MKVFIGWSGSDAKYVGEQLREWLPFVDQALKPWISDVDIEKGTQWRDEISGALSDDETAAGIFCITPSNAASPWISWEAGYLTGLSRRVCPYAFGYKRATDVPEPWASRQVTTANESETLQMVEVLCKNHDGDVVVVRKAFEKFWPDLQKALKDVPAKDAPVEKSTDEKIDEILQLLRSQRSGSRVVAAGIDLNTPHPKARIARLDPSVFKAAVATGYQNAISDAEKISELVQSADLERLEKFINSPEADHLRKYINSPGFQSVLASVRKLSSS